MPPAARPPSAALAGDRRFHGRRRSQHESHRAQARHHRLRPDHSRRAQARQGLLHARRRVRPAPVSGGQGRVVPAAQGQDARARRRVGIGQDDGRPDAHAPARGVIGRGAVRGPRHPVDVSARIHGLQAAHPDHLPESVRVAQSALHHRPDPDRADDDPRHRRPRRRSAPTSPSRCCTRSACRRSRSTSIRTNSPAASASASRSRAV